MKEEKFQEIQGDFSSDGNKEQIGKAKMNLVYVGIFSVVMFFAGLISAYVVSMGDSFWLKVPMPNAFWISTTLILISSLTLILGLRFARSGNTGGLKSMMGITFALGLAFVYFQFKGYSELVSDGVHFSFNRIVVTDGRYGDYFEIEKDGKYVEVNGNDFFLSGEKMSDAEMKDLQSFMKQFENPSEDMKFNVKEYGDYKILFKNRELTLKDGELLTHKGEPLQFLDAERLSFLAVNICDGRGDFFVRGKMGEDFHVYYKGKELSYENRELIYQGAKLDPYLQVKALESYDTASSFLYIITFAHLLHVIITVLFLLRAVIFSFSGKINANNTIRLQMTGIFWHFLGLLWVILLLFLLFIH
jgi:cytochrome c oxidase subunit 3